MAARSTRPASVSPHIAVIGAGAWGTALALLAARAGARVRLWAHEAETVAAITASRENRSFLPGVAIPETVTATGDLAVAADGAEAVLMVTPAQHLRAVLGRAAPHLAAETPLVLCAKGIEAGTGLLMTEVARAVVPGAPLAVLSGPSFAADVARGLPTAVTLAADDMGLAERLAGLLAGPAFRPYLSGDPLGAEIGGAVKNVLAIACGMVDGLGLGASARAALIARGFAEMGRFARALGAQPETLGGLSGLGDLILTCTSAQSRNFAFGVMLGEGADPDHARDGFSSVAEGAATAAPLVARAERLGVEMPIAEAVAAILEKRLAARDAVTALMARPLRAEAG